MKKIPAFNIAFSGITLALALTLSFVETLLPPIAFLPPGFKLGLSNIAVMYSLFTAPFLMTLAIAVLKSVFVLVINGGYAFVLSLCGSLLSVCTMWLLIKIFKDKISYLSVSVAGANAHNAAQIIAVWLITASKSAFLYLPILLIAAVLCGAANAFILKIVIPVLKKYNVKGNLK